MNAEKKPTDPDGLAQRNIEAIRRIEERQRGVRTFMDKISIQIAKFAGSSIFVWLHVAFFTAWISCNLVLVNPFDEYPFTFLTLVVSLEAIFLSSFILISQNIAEDMAQKRAHLDLQINLLSEQEDSHSLKVLLAIAEKVGVDVDGKTAYVLQQGTRPERIAEQIDQLTDPAAHKAH